MKSPIALIKRVVALILVPSLVFSMVPLRAFGQTPPAHSGCPDLAQGVSERGHDDHRLPAAARELESARPLGTRRSFCKGRRLAARTFRRRLVHRQDQHQSGRESGDSG